MEQKALAKAIGVTGNAISNWENGRARPDVNLIPANEVAEKPHARSSDESIRRFCAVLEKNGVAVTVRRTLGSDINASCGQLRRKQLTEDQERGDRP